MAEPTQNEVFERQRIAERLQELEQRVAALERRAESPESPAVGSFLPTLPRAKEKRATSTSAVPVLGKAVLAIAGAYLLRAVAESGAAPRSIMLLSGIVYAGVWLVWAVRSHRRSHFASVVFALTAATILPPLLWEGTVRFEVLTAAFAAAVLVGTVVLSLVLAWKDKLEAIPWIATTAAVGTALALIVATHELRALTTALLAIALATEVVAGLGRWVNLRLVTAPAADFAVLLLGVVMTSANGVPATYRAMSARELNAFCVALLLIYGGSLAVRAFVMQKELTFAEVVQAAVATGIGTSVSLAATQGESARPLGTVFLLVAVVCYWGALRRFTGPEQKRNRRVSANYAAGLVLAGSLLTFHENFQVVAFSVAAIAAVVAFTRTKDLSLGIHGTCYLLAAGTAGHLFGFVGKSLAGTVPAWPNWSFWLIVLAGLGCYLLGSRASGEAGKERILWVVPAAVVASAVAALGVMATADLAQGGLGASRVSMLRTVVTCVMALALGYAGSRWNRVELGWVAYGAIGLGALKLVAEDLRFGNAATLMVSLLFYGLILILLPRLTRFGRVEV